MEKVNTLLANGYQRRELVAEGVTLFQSRSADLLIILSSKPGLSDPRAQPVRAAPVTEGPLAPRCSRACLPSDSQRRSSPLPMPLRLATTPAVSHILMHSE
ncbi:hypothetical protein QQF64_012311 [Cirrhinus molitorella]|uniref:Uncharacterized protein n=1 Tax=Cirrhinus molitorella TaxID=172907 RepID=A0ABR3LXP2_9TELE